MDHASFPVIINSFNQPSYLKNMVRQISSRGYKNIIIIDQGSSSEKLKSLLETYERDFSVIRLRNNHGPHWFFTSGLARNFPDWFAYTDPDLQLQDDLHDDFILEMIELAKKYNATKIGLALDIDAPGILDIPINIWGKDYTTVTWEHQFWEKRIDDENFEIYEAPVDTTFAVYNKANFSRYIEEFQKVKAFDCMSTPGSYRIAGNFKAIHLPWMRDNKMPQDEWDIYIKFRSNIHDY